MRDDDVSEKKMRAKKKKKKKLLCIKKRRNCKQKNEKWEGIVEKERESERPKRKK